MMDRYFDSYIFASILILLIVFWYIPKDQEKVQEEFSCSDRVVILTEELKNPGSGDNLGFFPVILNDQEISFEVRESKVSYSKLPVGTKLCIKFIITNPTPVVITNYQKPYVE